MQLLLPWVILQGIGPEVILKSFTDEYVASLPIVIFGDYAILSYFKNLFHLDGFDLNPIKSIEEAKFSPHQLNVLDFQNVSMDDYEIGTLKKEYGEASFNYIVESIQAVLDGKARSVVTGPINKEALHLAGHIYPGHTEIFAEYAQSNDYAMLLYDEKLSVIHVSTHVALEKAIKLITKERIQRVIELAAYNMSKIKNGPVKIAVAGLNPHASENGLFGQQENEIIAPAVEAMKDSYDVIGPISPDTIFSRGLKKEFDIVIAMYHDQGHIPFKLYAFDSGVNTSVGLSIIRTSVDHGTAFDITGKGIAKFESMIAAIRLCDKLSS
jgi:4-phospho-D-threonate 3-dehydrogenase / 4-phospho-D-erythronate 3-dehydrogenase